MHELATLWDLRKHYKMLKICVSEILQHESKHNQRMFSTCSAVDLSSDANARHPLLAPQLDLSSYAKVLALRDVLHINI